MQPQRFRKPRMNEDTDYMAIALDMKGKSRNKHRQVGAVLTNGVAAHNTYVTRLERPTTTLHAEAAAICHSAASGMPTEGFEIYVTLSPCVSCAKLIIQSKIKVVHFYELDAQQIEAISLLRTCGVRVHGPLKEPEEQSESDD